KASQPDDYSGRTLANSTSPEALQASTAASWLRANPASRGGRRIGVVSAMAACADRLPSTSAKYASAFFPESMAMCAPAIASNKIIIGVGTDVSLGGGRSYSTRQTTTKRPSPGCTFKSLWGGAFHSQAGRRKAYVSVNLRDS